jgi:hypothetical protein
VLTAAAPAGARTLEVSSTEGFAASDFIRINPGGDNEEDNQIQIASIGSLVLATPLAFPHQAGEKVAKISPTPTPTPTSVVSAAEATPMPTAVAPVALPPTGGGGLTDGIGSFASLALLLGAAGLALTGAIVVAALRRRRSS